MRFRMSCKCNLRRVNFLLLYAKAVRIRLHRLFPGFFCLQRTFGNPMKNIADRFFSFMRTAAKASVLVALCGLFGAAIVYPLCRLASASPELYSACVIAVLSVLLAVLCVQKVRRSGIRSAAYILARIAAILSGLFVSAKLLLSGRRLSSLLVLLAAVALYGIVSIALCPSEKKHPPKK